MNLEMEQKPQQVKPQNPQSAEKPIIKQKEQLYEAMEAGEIVELLDAEYDAAFWRSVLKLKREIK